MTTCREAGSTVDWDRMEYRIIPVTAFQQNCTLLWKPASQTALVTDPGGDLERIQAAIDANGVEVTHILLTHGHIDHCAGAPELAKQLGVPIFGPRPEDRFLLESLPQQSKIFGLPPARAFVPDQWLQGNEELQLQGTRVQVLHCPGHTPGHLCYFFPDSRLAVVGDVLFHGAIGRTDFPRGDHATLLRSIRDRLLPLGDDVVFIPGHGPRSTLGEERLHNPFLQS